MNVLDRSVIPLPKIRFVFLRGLTVLLGALSFFLPFFLKGLATNADAGTDDLAALEGRGMQSCSIL